MEEQRVEQKRFEKGRNYIEEIVSMNQKEGAKWKRYEIG